MGVMTPPGFLCCGVCAHVGSTDPFCMQECYVGVGNASSDPG